MKIEDWTNGPEGFMANPIANIAFVYQFWLLKWYTMVTMPFNVFKRNTFLGASTDFD